MVGLGQPCSPSLQFGTAAHVAAAGPCGAGPAFECRHTDPTPDVFAEPPTITACTARHGVGAAAERTQRGSGLMAHASVPAGCGGSGPTQPAVPPGLRALSAAAAVAPARRGAPAPRRLRMPQPPTVRQQWAEAYTLVGHTMLGACANAQGEGARGDALQAVQEFGALARTVIAYSRSRRSGAAAAARATRIADGLPVEDAGGEEDSERTAGLRRPHLSDAQRQAARIERCLHQKRSIHQGTGAVQDSCQMLQSRRCS